ncbi:hypothetical protein ETD96_37230, partial [Actinomadura geliboluensis]
MAAGDIVPVTGEWFEQTLESASPDLLRTMVREMAQRMMDNEVEQVCGAGYGEVSDTRVTTRLDVARTRSRGNLPQQHARPGFIGREQAIERLDNGHLRFDRANTCADSSPIAPSPSTINDSGTRSVRTASRLVQYGTSGRPSTGAGGVCFTGRAEGGP